MTPAGRLPAAPQPGRVRFAAVRRIDSSDARRRVGRLPDRRVQLLVGSRRAGRAPEFGRGGLLEADRLGAFPSGGILQARRVVWFGGGRLGSSGARRVAAFGAILPGFGARRLSTSSQSRRVFPSEARGVAAPAPRRSGRPAGDSDNNNQLQPLNATLEKHDTKHEGEQFISVSWRWQRSGQNFTVPFTLFPVIFL